MFQATEKTVEEITTALAHLAGLLPRIGKVVNNLKTHAAVARKNDLDVQARKKNVLEILESMKRVNAGIQTNAMILYRSGVFPSASKLILLLNGHTRHLQRLIGFVETYGDVGPFNQIETELAELSKLYEETLVFLRKEEGKKAAA